MAFHVTPPIVLNGVGTLADASGNVTVPNMTASGNIVLSSATGKVILFGTTEGGALTQTTERVRATGIVNNTGTTLLTITIPNVSTKGYFHIRYAAGFDAAPVNDSTRVVEYNISFTRVAATVAAVGISAAVGAAIATVAAGATLTTALTLSAVTGGATATNTFNVTITNVASAGTPTTSVLGEVTGMNETVGGATIA